MGGDGRGSRKPTPVDAVLPCALLPLSQVTALPFRQVEVRGLLRQVSGMPLWYKVCQSPWRRVACIGAVLTSNLAFGKPRHRLGRGDSPAARAEACHCSQPPLLWRKCPLQRSALS